MSELTFDKPETLPFVISLYVRDGLGRPTNRKKVFEAGTGNEICEWYEKNSFKKPSKKNKGKPAHKYKKNKKVTKDKNV